MLYSQPVAIAPRTATARKPEKALTKPERRPAEQLASQVDAVLCKIKAEHLQDVFNRLAELPPSETTHITFTCIGNLPIKQTIKVSSRIFGPVNVDVFNQNLTEADIEETLAVTQDYEARVRLRNFSNLIRAMKEDRQPLEIKLVNPSEVGKFDKVVSVKRDDAGKLSACVVQSIT
jgi:hypothetical protein